MARRLQTARDLGYRVHLVFLRLPDSAMAVQRVATRVRQGGHDVPRDTIERRFTAGLVNLQSLYLELADSWWLFDSSTFTPELIATSASSGTSDKKVFDRTRFQQIMRAGNNE